jgi:hypothetical protein
MDINKVIGIIRQHKLNEMMTATGGNLAGLPPDEPPVFKKKKDGKPTIIGRGKFSGARTRWRKGL